MPLPTLSWLTATETLISASTPDYAAFINAVEAKINASTYWAVNNKTLDAANSRGHIELKPKSSLAGVTEGRVLLLFSTGTAAGAGGLERPLAACRQPPWNSASTSLQCKMWVGFSDNANSSASGPTNDPWTSATPYGATPNWSRLFPLNANNPAANDTLGLIESAEGLCLYWAVVGGANIQGIIVGRLLEELDGNTGYWMLSGLYCSADNALTTTGWNSVASAAQLPPFGLGSFQHSAASPTRSWAVAFKSGLLYGVGRNWEAIAANQVTNAMSGPAGAVFQSILMGGGFYVSGSSDGLQGVLRQLRWGPPAYRGQRLFSGGIEQGIHLNYATVVVGAKPGGIWFDHFR